MQYTLPLDKEIFCYGCEQDKPRNEFNKDRHKKSGLQYKCKLCQKKSRLKDILRQVNYVHV